MGRLLVTRAFISVSDHGEMRMAQVRGLPKLKTGELYDETAARNAGISQIFSIGDETNPVGFLGIGRPLDKTRSFDPDETGFITALLGLAASGIANASAHAETQRVNRDLDQRIELTPA
jgi:hypothetical protein